MIKKILLLTALTLLPSFAVTALTNEQVRQLLTGLWGITTVIEGINTYSTTEFKNDGTVIFNLTLSASDGAYKYKSHGKWTVEDKTVLMEVTFSDSPDYLHVGDKLKYHIIKINDKTLEYTDDHGAKVTQQRM